MWLNDFRFKLYTSCIKTVEMCGPRVRGRMQESLVLSGVSVTFTARFTVLRRLTEKFPIPEEDEREAGSSLMSLKVFLVVKPLLKCRLTKCR